MLRSVKAFKHFKLRARDGDLGKVREFYFDDTYWTVRYLVAETGGWLSGRLVLISPYSLGSANEAEQVLPVDLTMKQIEESPSLASNEVVSHLYEEQYYDYYGWPRYWSDQHNWGESPYLGPVDLDLDGISPDMRGEQEARRENAHREGAWDPNLRSTAMVTDHYIQAQDGDIGHVEDFIIDDETWAIRYLVVNTKNWWPGKHVLVSPQWIYRVSWEESKVFIDLSREAIKQSPEYTPESLNRDYETTLHQHYSRQGYWAD